MLSIEARGFYCCLCMPSVHFIEPNWHKCGT